MQLFCLIFFVFPHKLFVSLIWRQERERKSIRETLEKENMLIFLANDTTEKCPQFSPAFFLSLSRLSVCLSVCLSVWPKGAAKKETPNLWEKKKEEIFRTNSPDSWRRERARLENERMSVGGSITSFIPETSLISDGFYYILSWKLQGACQQRPTCLLCPAATCTYIPVLGTWGNNQVVF